MPGRSALWWLLSAFAVCAAATSAAAAKVPLYGFLEGSIEHRRSYADPYRDVTPRVHYTRPDGTRLTFWGFPDGGRTWRFRACAAQPGRWKFEVEMSDGSLCRQGEFHVSGHGRLPGMICVHRANPVWFGSAGGRPLLDRGLHAGDRFFAAN